MPVRRFFAEDLSHDQATVCGAQAHHGLHVLRLGLGDAVSLFDGGGASAEGVITHTESDAFTVRVTSRMLQTAVGRLALAVASPKGPRADWLVEKTAELGVSEIWPLLTDRGQVLPGESKVERWRRKAVEAAKQSRSPRVMQIRDPATVEQVLDASDGISLRCYADLRAGRVGVFRWIEDTRRSGESVAAVLGFIGPEGGFTDQECERFSTQSVTPISLGPCVLRVETAAIAFAAIWLAAHPAG